MWCRLSLRLLYYYNRLTYASIFFAIYRKKFTPKTSKRKLNHFYFLLSICTKATPGLHFRLLKYGNYNKKMLVFSQSEKRLCSLHNNLLTFFKLFELFKQFKLFTQNVKRLNFSRLKCSTLKFYTLT